MKKTTHKQTYIHVGNFTLWHEAVQLYAHVERDGGECWLNPDPDNGKSARLYVGLDQPWPQVLEVLVHEALELMCHRHGLILKPARQCTLDTSGFTFIFDHAQYTQLCGALGIFLSVATKPLREAWDKHRPKTQR